MTQSILLREITYLKAENTILRSRCPKQIQTTLTERSLLVRLGIPLGNAIHEMLSLSSTSCGGALGGASTNRIAS